MKISPTEVEQIRRAKELDAGTGTHAVAVDLGRASTAPTSEAVHEVACVVEATPDVREDVVEAIRARTSQGTYAVSSEEIAELIVRRALADKVR